MLPNKNLFDLFEDIQQFKVIVADNTKLQVKGSGGIDIHISVKGETRKVTIKEVLYVPNLNVNLLSVSKITEKGFVVKFKEKVFEITNGNDLVAIAKLKNDIYMLSQPSNVVCLQS